MVSRCRIESGFLQQILSHRLDTERYVVRAIGSARSFCAQTRGELDSTGQQSKAKGWLFLSLMWCIRGTTWSAAARPSQYSLSEFQNKRGSQQAGILDFRMPLLPRKTRATIEERASAVCKAIRASLSFQDHSLDAIVTSVQPAQVFLRNCKRKYG